MGHAAPPRSPNATKPDSPTLPRPTVRLCLLRPHDQAIGGVIHKLSTFLPESQASSAEIVATPTSSAKEIAEALLNRRETFRGRSNTDRDEIQALAEAVVMSRYGRTPREEDLHPLGRSLQFITKDLSGRRVRVLQRGFPPFRSWSRTLNDADLHVFVKVYAGIAEISGWLPVSRIEEAVMVFWEQDGKKTDYAHEIEGRVLHPMPDTFDFSEPCPHSYVSEEMPGVYGAIWKDTPNAWECFGCGRLVDDARGRERVARWYEEQRANNQPGDPVSETA